MDLIDSAMVQGDDVFISQFSALEAKVLRAVQVIHSLRDENERLKSELDELRRHIQELNSAVDAASTAAQEAERWKADSGIRKPEDEHRSKNHASPVHDRFSAPERSINPSNSSTSSRHNGEMHRVEVEIFGQFYNIIGEDDAERVRYLARLVDDRMNEIARTSKGMSALKVAILAALNISDDLVRTRETLLNLQDSEKRLLLELERVIEE